MLPLVLLLFAAFGILLLPYSLPLVAACLIGVMIAILLLYQMLTAQRPVKLTEIMACSLLTGYCGGCAITVSFVGLDQHGITDPSWITVPSPWVVFAIVIVLIVSACLLTAGQFEAPLLRGDEVIQVGRREEWLIWTGCAVVVTEVILGQFGYMGTTAQEGTGRVEILADLASSFLLINLPLAAIGWMQSKGLRRFRFGALALIFLVATVPVGRRVLAYSVLLTVFAAVRLSGVSLSLGRKKWLLAVGGTIAVLAASVVFIGLRLATDYLPAGNKSMAQIMTASDRVIADPNELLDSTEENLESRPFGLTSYLALLAKDGRLPEPLYGKDLYYGIGDAVPDAFYHFVGASKNSVRENGGEEELANEHFGLPVFDGANSILTGGVIDLGLIGLILYPVGMCLFWRILNLDVRWFCGAQAQLLFALFTMNSLIQTEKAVGGYFSEARDAIIIIGVWMMLGAIPRLRRARQAGTIRAEQSLSRSPSWQST